MEKKMKQILILLTGAIYVFFMYGYIVGMNRERENLKEMCTEYLQIEKEDIKSVSYHDNSLVIDLYSIDEDISISNRAIYDKFKPELVLDLKDRVKKQDIQIQ